MKRLATAPTKSKSQKSNTCIAGKGSPSTQWTTAILSRFLSYFIADRYNWNMKDGGWCAVEKFVPVQAYSKQPKTRLRIVLHFAQLLLHFPSLSLSGHHFFQDLSSRSVGSKHIQRFVWTLQSYRMLSSGQHEIKLCITGSRKYLLSVKSFAHA